jgi:hypothetical protein
MELSSIVRMEQFLCDSLIASPLIPLSVNVLRLADVAQNEGIVTQTNNIVVRYTNSSTVVKNRIPLVYEETMYFELNFSCQNYLSSSGHDFATQLLMAAKITLSGSVPSGAFVQAIEPFHCTSSQFTGLTPQSQYTYTQTYSLIVEEVLPYIALDPCVQRGDCRQIFPSENVETSLPLAGIVDPETGYIYVPWYPETDEIEAAFSRALGVKWSDELRQSGDWVYVCAPNEVFIEDPINQPIYLLSNDNFTEDGKLVVTIWDKETKTPIGEVFYINTGKKLVRYAIELWRNTIQGSENGSIASDSVLDASFTSHFTVGEFAVVKGAFQKLYTDPLNPNASIQTLTGGTLIGVVPDTFVQTPFGRLYLVARSPKGKGWILKDGFEIASINSLFKLGCLPCEGGPNPPPLC